MPDCGAVVIATAGRDKDRLFVVIRADESGVWLADGKSRPLSRPKRKNPRHLRETGHSVNASEMATNRELRCVLRPYRDTIT